MEPLVIGLGNAYRGDDAAGLLAVRGVRNGRRLERGDCTDLIDLLKGEERVVIVDAMRSGREAGFVHRFDAHDDELPLRTFVSSHSMGVAETIELARALDRLPETLSVFGIEVGEIGTGEEVSAEVHAAAGQVAKEIEELVG